MALINKEGNLLSNISENIVRFHSQQEYDNWEASLPNYADIEKFVILKLFDNPNTMTVKGVDYIINHIPGKYTDLDLWSKIAETINSSVNSDITYSPSIFGSTGLNLRRWGGGVLAPNDKIYGIPVLANSILEINPSTRTISTFGSIPSPSSGGASYHGGVLAKNGKIYGIPANSTSVLELDPTTKEINFFGDLVENSDKYYGGAMALNGRIYCAPFYSNKVLEINPYTKTILEFGNVSGRYVGAVLAPNGKIYCMPYDEYTYGVLEIDPDTRTTSDISIGTFIPENNKWNGGVLAANGKIYGIPHNATRILEIDPVTRTASTFANLSGTQKWIGGALAPNGKIYCMPATETTVLEIDPATKTATKISGVASGTNKFNGGVLAQNGKIYGIPLNSDGVLELNPSRTPDPFPDPDCYLSAYLNKL